MDTAISGDIVIPDTLGGCPVTAIGNNAFESCESMTGIAVPDSMVTIGHRAFVNCKNLKSAILHDGITIIGDRAFSGCENVVIYGFEESYVRQYANKNDLPFENVEEKTPLFENEEIDSIRLTPKSKKNNSSFPLYKILIIIAVVITVVAVIIAVVGLIVTKKKKRPEAKPFNEEVLTTYIPYDNINNNPYDDGKPKK